MHEMPFNRRNRRFHSGTYGRPVKWWFSWSPIQAADPSQWHSLDLRWLAACGCVTAVTQCPFVAAISSPFSQRLKMFFIERGQDSPQNFPRHYLVTILNIPGPALCIHFFEDRGIYLSAFFRHLRVPLGHFQLLRIAPSASSIYVRPIRSPTAFQPRLVLSSPCYPTPHLFSTPSYQHIFFYNFFSLINSHSRAMTPLKINSFGVPKMKAVI